MYISQQSLCHWRVSVNSPLALVQAIPSQLFLKLSSDNERLASSDFILRQRKKSAGRNPANWRGGESSCRFCCYLDSQTGRAVWTDTLSLHGHRSCDDDLELSSLKIHQGVSQSPLNAISLKVFGTRLSKQWSRINHNNSGHFCLFGHLNSYDDIVCLSDLQGRSLISADFLHPWWVWRQKCARHRQRSDWMGWWYVRVRPALLAKWLIGAGCTLKLSDRE
jgi:hypothetical protein